MGGFVGVGICILAAVLFWDTGYPLLFSFAVIAAIVAFWSWGIMSNHATRSAANRRKLSLEIMRSEGRSDDEIRAFDARIIRPDAADLNVIPDWLSGLNMIATLAGAALLAWGVLVRIF